MNSTHSRSALGLPPTSVSILRWSSSRAVLNDSISASGSASDRTTRLATPPSRQPVYHASALIEEIEDRIPERIDFHTDACSSCTILEAELC